MDPRTVIAFVLLPTLVGLASCSRARDDEAAAQKHPPKVASSAAPPTAPAARASAPAEPSSAITDSVITTRIKAGILSDPGMAGSDVSVNTDRGVVSLTGVVRSQEQAAIASAHAQRQDGVMRVDNMLAANLH
jgi:hyperosmotically inducible protein